MACHQGQLLNFSTARQAHLADVEARKVTVGMRGKVTLFTQRGSQPDEGYVRVNGKTVTGYVPQFGRGGKVFYPFSGRRNTKEAA
jgi:hypothetical protein